jgi:hypothetical protein
MIETRYFFKLNDFKKKHKIQSYSSGSFGFSQFEYKDDTEETLQALKNGNITLSNILIFIKVVRFSLYAKEDTYSELLSRYVTDDVLDEIIKKCPLKCRPLIELQQEIYIKDHNKEKVNEVTKKMLKKIKIQNPDWMQLIGGMYSTKSLTIDRIVKESIENSINPKELLKKKYKILIDPETFINEYEKLISQEIIKKVKILTTNQIRFALRILFPKKPRENQKEAIQDAFSSMVKSYREYDELTQKYFDMRMAELFEHNLSYERYPHVASEDFKKYRELKGYRRYSEFEVISEFMFNEMSYNDDKQKNQHQQRTIFWSNYKHKIIDIIVLVPPSKIDGLRNYVSEKESRLSLGHINEIKYSVNENMICIIELEKLIIVENITGREDSLVYRKKDVEHEYEKIKNSKIRDVEKDYERLIIKSYEYKYTHEHKWQAKVFNFLKEVGIFSIYEGKGIYIHKTNSNKFLDPVYIPRKDMIDIQ